LQTTQQTQNETNWKQAKKMMMMMETKRRTKMKMKRMRRMRMKTRRTKDAHISAREMQAKKRKKMRRRRRMGTGKARELAKKMMLDGWRDASNEDRAEGAWMRELARTHLLSHCSATYECVIVKREETTERARKEATEREDKCVEVGVMMTITRKEAHERAVGTEM
jgi:hypothetical protein